MSFATRAASKTSGPIEKKGAGGKDSKYGARSKFGGAANSKAQASKGSALN